MSDLGNKEIFAKNLKYYMDLNQKDRNDICRDLGFAYTTFAEWYNGKIYPRIDKIEMLAKYFNIKKSDLIENHNSNTKKDDFRFASNNGINTDGLDEDDIKEINAFVEFIKNKKKNGGT